MRHLKRPQKTILITPLLALMIGGGAPWVVMAQALPPQGQAPPSYPPGELDKLVSRIALFPDPLLAQILAAATFPDQIPDAAKWADEHHYLTGDELARAITEDHLPWDPSVQALLPFPSVLEMMASDMNWTSELGNAFLAQQQDVMDAVQRMRKKARDYGYLRTNGQVVVAGGPYITIMPVNPAFVCVPVYDPLVVFLRPGRDFLWAAPSVLASACRWASRSAPGDGASATSSGIGTNCTSATRAGAGTGRNRGSYVHPYHGVQRWSGSAAPWNIMNA